MIKEKFYQTEILFPKMVIDIEGKVFEDEGEGKDKVYNGLIDEKEKGIKGVKVIAYDKRTGKEIDFTYTNEDGVYTLKELLVGRYEVVFEYDGQTYEATEFLTGFNFDQDDPNNSENWKENSKARESEQGREDFNNQFYEITGERTGSSKQENLSSILAGLGISETNISKGTAIAKDGTMREIIYKTENGISQAITRDKDNVPLETYRMRASTATSTDKSQGFFVPTFPNFLVSSVSIPPIMGVTYEPVYEHIRYIHLGLKTRPTADIALKKDVLKTDITINNKQLTYKLNARNGMDNYDIELKQQPDYANMKYNQSIYDSDYTYRIEDYKNNSLSSTGDEIHGFKSEDEELKVFLTYKITIMNQSLLDFNRINELTDYYDPTYQLVKEDVYLPIQNAEGVIENKKVVRSPYFVTQEGTEYPVEFVDMPEPQDGYKKMETSSLKEHKIESGKWIEIYITFEMEKDGDRAIKLGEKENTVEITNYSIFDYDDPEKVTGRIDKDSAPDNITPSVKESYEDDSDNAPPITVTIAEDEKRTADGFVWEDSRTEKIVTDQMVAGTYQMVGNGTYDEKEGDKKIDGVTVQLIELVDHPSEQGKKLEYIWQEMQAGANTFQYVDHEGEVKTGTLESSKGSWHFNSYIPGDYIIRLKYGDSEQTLLSNTSAGLNGTSYNGHDYKSSAYRAILDQEGYYDFVNNEANTSKAKDNEQRRLEVINYSAIMTNENATKLAKYPVLTKEDPDYQELLEKTFMYADTAVMICDIEYNPSLGQTSKEIQGNANYSYHLQNMHFGIEERAKAAIEVQKEIENIRVILASGQVIINTAENLRENLNWIKQDRTDRYEKDILKKGRVDIYLDDEMMHGTRVEVTYKITIENKGEVDTIGKDGNLGDTYYTGQESEDKIATTRINKIIDYLDSKDKKGARLTYVPERDVQIWEKRRQDEIENYIDPGIFAQMNEDNIFVSEQLKSISLKPGESTEIRLVASSVITAENQDLELVYNNIAELIEISSDTGRRDYEAIPGNQESRKPPKERDASYAEAITILKPTGEDLRKVPVVNLVVLVSAGAIVIIGIMIIKKKVLKVQN